MSNSVISLGLGLGGGKAATSSGRAAGGGGFENQFSVNFDGTDDYLTADAGAALRSTDAVSFSQWLNLDAIGPLQRMFSLGNTSSLNDRVQAFVSSSGAVVAYVKLAGAAKSGNSSSTASVGQWLHYIVTLDNTNGIKIYFNGSLENTVAVSAGYLSNNSNLLQIRMSARATSLTNFVNGKIDDGVPSDLSSYSPVHWWRFGDNDDGTGTTLTDQGSTGKNATLFNGPTFSSNVPS